MSNAPSDEPARPAAGVDVSAPEKPAPGAPDIVLLNQDNFYDSLTAAGDSLVVVDFFTDWSEV